MNINYEEIIRVTRHEMVKNYEKYIAEDTLTQVRNRSIEFCKTVINTYKKKKGQNKNNNNAKNGEKYKIICDDETHYLYNKYKRSKVDWFLNEMHE